MLRWTIHFLEISSNDLRSYFSDSFSTFLLSLFPCLPAALTTMKREEVFAGVSGRGYADAGHLTRREERWRIIINKEIDIPASIKSSGEEDFRFSTKILFDEILIGKRNYLSRIERSEEDSSIKEAPDRTKGPLVVLLSSRARKGALEAKNKSSPIVTRTFMVRHHAKKK